MSGDASTKSESWGVQSSAYSNSVEHWLACFAQHAVDKHFKFHECKSTERNSIQFLDIGTGTGSLGKRVLLKLQELEMLKTADDSPAAQLYLTDYSDGMITIARSAIQQLVGENIKVGETLSDQSPIIATCMNGQDLKFDDNTMTHIGAFFTIMFFTDHRKGLEEMYRVLKKGGMVVVTSWHENAAMDLFLALSRFMGKLGATEVPTEHDTTLLWKDNEDQLRLDFAQAGFSSVEIDIVGADHTMLLEEAVVANFVQNPVIKSYFRGASAADIANAVPAFLETAEGARFRTDEKLTVKIPMSAKMLVATK